VRVVALDCHGSGVLPWRLARPRHPHAAAALYLMAPRSAVAVQSPRLDRVPTRSGHRLAALPNNGEACGRGGHGAGPRGPFVCRGRGCTPVPMSETWILATVVLAAVIVVLALLLVWRRL
jgi:hypothetical protein